MNKIISYILKSQLCRYLFVYLSVLALHSVFLLWFFIIIQEQTQTYGDVTFHPFDPVTVQLSLDRSNLQHEKLVFKLVLPHVSMRVHLENGLFPLLYSDKYEGCSKKDRTLEMACKSPYLARCDCCGSLAACFDNTLLFPAFHCMQNLLSYSLRSEQVHHTFGGSYYETA
jgi:hypothetical protein